MRVENSSSEKTRGYAQKPRLKMPFKNSIFYHFGAMLDYKFSAKSRIEHKVKQTCVANSDRFDAYKDPNDGL
jgi:hypothetical protein